MEWGGAANADRPGDARGHFRQRWFAGNHSDIGGSYPEEESRLSDVALAWMVDEATQPPHPILIDRRKLCLFPDAHGPQHCEVFAQQQQQWWKRLIPWPTKPRAIDKENGDIDESVLERFRATCIVDCDRQIPYRPEALREHIRVVHFYRTDHAASDVAKA